MSVTTYEATVEQGQIRLVGDVRLPERARVYVVVPDAPDIPRVRAGSPRQAHPEQAPAFIKEVLRDADEAD